MPFNSEQDRIAADNYAAFRVAARNNDRSTMEIFIALFTPDNVAKMISVFNWDDLYDALRNGKLDTLECLIKHAPKYVADMIDSHLPGMINSDGGDIFVLLFNSSIFEWFLSYVGEGRFWASLVKPVGEFLSLAALFEDNPESLYLNIEKLLALLGPVLAMDLVGHTRYEPFRLAAHKADRNLMNIYLASIPPENRERMIKSCFPEDTKILQRIDRVEIKYANPDVKIKEQAFLWVAKKEGVAPIYILGSRHLVSRDTQLRFLDLINTVLDKVETSFTESATPVVQEPKGIDDLVEHRANMMGKNQKYLESLRSLKLMHGKKLMSEILDAKDSEIYKDAVASSEEWFLTNCASASLEALADTGLDHLTSLRNKFWMEDILKESTSQKSCMVTVGAMHNQGIFGLPNLLANEGYNLTPLAKTAPTPTRVLLRDLLTGSSHNVFFSAGNLLPREAAGLISNRPR